MNIEAEKIVLVKRLLDTDDEGVINQLKEVFERSEKDFWNDLPEHVKQGIEQSKRQAEAGLFTPHDEVMKKYTDYL